MSINFKFMTEIQPSNYKKTLLISLISVLLISALAIGIFAPNAEGQSTIHVGTETELRTAISNAATSVPVDITLDKEIGLTGGTLTIPANKEVTLRSNGNAEFELFGASGTNAIAVENRGVLTLAGITITHANGASGGGVAVNSGGRLTMSGGKVSDNAGNGVINGGNFTLSGGRISNNTGSGVINSGSFVMSGGAVTNNKGCGVDSAGSFTLNGGEISNNHYGVQLTAASANFSMTNGKISGNTGDGVYISRGAFTLFGGEIVGNGRGVSNSGTFTMSNGKISGNTADSNGGGVYNIGIFTMNGGEISNNVVTGSYNGGGVWTNGNFTMSGGEISKNTALNGGGVFVDKGNFNLYGGKILGNTATRNGGGVWVTDTVTNFDRLTVRNGVVFSDNRASASYSRDSEHDSIYRAYIEDNVKWSGSFTQGYNNYDISYVSGTSVTRFTVFVDDAHGTPTGAGTYSAGDTVTLNAGTQPGYTFAYWAVKEGGLSLASSSTVTFTMPANNVDVVAVWTAVQYRITYNLNGGETGWGRSAEFPVTYTYTRDSSFFVAIADPIKKEWFPLNYNYPFSGWTITYADGTQERSGASYSIPAGTVGDITLEANWAPKSLMQQIKEGATAILLMIVFFIVMSIVCYLLKPRRYRTKLYPRRDGSYEIGYEEEGG
jgi:hypothetical protein